MISIPKKIIWLASYPKSGNTWFRAFLTALLNDGIVHINHLDTNNIFSSRAIFDSLTDLDSADLTDEEAKLLQPAVFNMLATQEAGPDIFVKVHDAYVFNNNKAPIIPTESTACAIYFVRNPLDIAGSLANHLGKSIDKAIDCLNDPFYAFSPQKNNHNTESQLKQFLSDWSFHVESWTSCMAFPVYVIKYEDMLTDSLNTFKQALQFIGWNHYKDGDILKAINSCSFGNLKAQEVSDGFKEKHKKITPYFFRKGDMNNWKNELLPHQSNRIINIHKKMMSRFRYFPFE